MDYYDNERYPIDLEGANLVGVNRVERLTSNRTHLLTYAEYERLDHSDFRLDSFIFAECCYLGDLP